MTPISTTGEKEPLLSSSPGSTKFYFLNKQDESYQGGITSSVRDTDGGVEAEFPPNGTTDDEFAPRQVIQKKPPGLILRQAEKSSNNGSSSMGGGGLFSKLFGGSKPTSSSYQVGTRPMLKTRKAPVKIEPKVFFANERTFLAWMHLSIILAGASIAILAFTGGDESNSNPFAQLYGVVLLPVAIAFIVYSMYQYARRSRMIRNRHPGPYEDTVGPVVLGILLMMSIVVQFALKLYSMAGQQ